MSGSVKHRTVTPLIKLIQDIGRGRKVVLASRYADEQAARTQPPPDIPGGPYHKTFEIYYYARDARREVQPPLLISGSKQIGKEEKVPEKKYFTPAKPYNWDA
ncbi:NADH dehydrogenase [ubiquinone] 1 alpha subcomplex subunit 7-like [Linepithema humile]|uniref:NADH dehydrogenase [ubiquinone] 1 alpha subcomplex subunit 7-like n=1 Tax=Linepithema humile TaxID=83485 RepID=UPI0006230453|nr:PREDICTED: NADH dehydrogenase [ubiquinone] 1 alpha subcomplex subunit 7-like [Linepithema humile]